MSKDEAQKLLGGYATGSLSEAERTALFQAALEDQELFDELAGEQVLKEVLDEPGARERLLVALEPPRKHRMWLWVPAAATVAIAVVIGIVVSQRTPPEPPQQIAQVLRSTEPANTPAAPPVDEAPPLRRKVAPVASPAVAPAPPPEAPAELRKEESGAVADQLQQAKPQASAGVVREFSAAAPKAGAARAVAASVGMLCSTTALAQDGILLITTHGPRLRVRRPRHDNESSIRELWSTRELPSGLQLPAECN